MIEIKTKKQQQRIKQILDHYILSDDLHSGCLELQKDGMIFFADGRPCLKITFEEMQQILDVLCPPKKETLDFSIVSPDMLDVVKDWLQYKREKGQSYKPSGFKSFYARLCKLSGNDPKIAQEIIEASKSNNYAGIFPLKKQNQRSELDYLPTGMILRGSQEEREEKIKSSKWW